MLLPSKHHFNDILIRYEQNRLGYAYVEQVLHSLREKFWLIKLVHKLNVFFEHESDDLELSQNKLFNA